MGFLLRAVLRTELCGAQWTEQAGAGILAGAAGAWLGVWDAGQAGDPEKLIQSAQAAAAGQGSQLAGALAVALPGDSSQALSDLGDALYVYGFPKAGQWPDSVQVLGKPSWPKPRKGIEVHFAATDAALPEGAPRPGQGADGITGACLAHLPSLPSETLVASEQDLPIGVAQLIVDGPVARVAYLWVAPEHRKQGVGAALLEQAAKKAQAAGCIAFSVWTRSSGLLRYYFPRFGFAQQLGASWFLPE